MASVVNIILAACLLSGLVVDAADVALKLVDCRQSSVHAGGVCERAIDGNTNQDWAGGSCTHSSLEAAPWWQANTERLASIGQVRIYNRLCGAACSAHLNDFVIKVDGVECASYRSDTFFSVETFTCGKVGQVVEIMSRKQTYLMPCEVQVFGTYVTLSNRGAPLPLSDCRQSSVHSGGVCERSIDRNTHQHWPGNSCSHTEHENNPWWQANTKQLARIQQVRIYNRLCGPTCSTFLSNIMVKVDGHECARYQSSIGYISTHTFDCDRVGQVVEIRGAGTTHLMICEVQVFGEYVPLENKGALLPLHDCRQSSTHTDCSKAIDGNTHQHWRDQNSCSHTQLETNPWWQANTKQLAHIKQVRIYARLCGPTCSMHLSSMVVKVDGHVCARYRSSLGYISTHTFDCDRVGQVVEVQAVGSTYLMLCELQVFGEYASLEHKGDLLPLLDCRQSSTHTDCNRAIDGNTHQHWPGNSCSHTQLEDNPWWQANTKELAHIQQVRIYARLCGPACSTHLSNILVKVDGHLCSSFQHKTEYISTHTFECDRVGQVIEIQGVGKTYVMLCELQVFGKYVTLGHKGVQLPLLDCRQSSTHTDCNRAIDGNTHQHWPGSTCSHTQLEENPWWQANIKQMAHIQQVRVYARLCGPGCSMYLSNILVKVDGHLCSSFQSKTEYISTHTFECDRVGQVIEIQGVGRTYVMLCELQVFGKYVALSNKGAPLTLYDCRQSSTHTDCNRAIDGNTHQHWPGNSCSHTQLEDNPWWQANTRQLARIQQVRIYARLCGPACSIHLSNILVKVDGHVCSSFLSKTEYISTHTFECNRVGQVVEIRGVGKTYLMLCELQVFGEYVPLENKGAQLSLSDCTQSSTHTPCQRAMDDDFNQHWPGNSCSHTQLEKNPWWQATIVEAAHVQQVRIYSRLCGPVCSRHLKNLVIKIDGQKCSRQNKTTGYISTHTFDCNKSGTTLRIESQATTYLMLCEVQVFGNYGDKPAVAEVKPEAPVPCKTLELPPCIDKHDLSKHNVSTSWVTKVPADEFCYQYTCTGKATDGVPVLTQCMDASGNCVNPGDKFACRPNPNNAVNCQCVRRLGNTTVETV